MMKKLLLIVASIASLALVSCSKDNSSKKGASFSKAEIVFEVLTSDLSKTVDDSFWDYLEFTLEGRDFNGTTFVKTVDGVMASKLTLTCTTAPTEGNDQVAELKVTPVLGPLPETLTVDYCIRVRCISYDGSGNILDDQFALRSSGKGTIKSTAFAADFKKPLLNTHFELFYDSASSDKPYRFSWKSL